MFFFVGLATLTDYNSMILVAALAGMGNAVMSPAINAFYLDITRGKHRSRIIGVKESSLALGGVLGPLAVAAISPFTTPQGIFWMAGVLGLISVLVGVILLREPEHSKDISYGSQNIQRIYLWVCRKKYQANEHWQLKLLCEEL